VLLVGDPTVRAVANQQTSEQLSRRRRREPEGIMTNLESVQSIYQAFGGGDIPAILARLAPDVIWDHDLPGYGVGYLEPGTGRADVAKFFAGLDVLDFESFDILNFLEGGNQVAVTI